MNANHERCIVDNFMSIYHFYDDSISIEFLIVQGVSLLLTLIFTLLVIETFRIKYI